MNSVGLKYHRCIPSGCKDIEIRKFKFEAKTQFLRSHHLKVNRYHEKTDLILWSWRDKTPYFLQPYSRTYKKLYEKTSRWALKITT